MNTSQLLLTVIGVVVVVIVAGIVLDLALTTITRLLWALVVGVFTALQAHRGGS